MPFQFEFTALSTFQDEMNATELDKTVVVTLTNPNVKVHIPLSELVRAQSNGRNATDEQVDKLNRTLKKIEGNLDNLKQKMSKAEYEDRVPDKIKERDR